MFWDIIKYLLLAGCAYLVFALVRAEQRRRFYADQGVAFCPYFPIITDVFRLIRQSIADQHRLPFFVFIKKALGVDHLPGFSGTFLFGMPMIFIADPDALEELYVTKNAAFTKHPLERQMSAPLLLNNIVNMDTDDPNYAPKKRVLSSAFYKGKV
jgi:hypothetical protein